MKKIITFGIFTFLSSVSCYSQSENTEPPLDDMYMETEFQGLEEEIYNPQNEIFIISSCILYNKSYSFEKDRSTETHRFNIDYKRNILTISIGSKVETYKVERDEKEYFWSKLPTNYITQGYLYNSKNEKFIFSVEEFVGTIWLRISYKQGPINVYYAKIQNSKNNQ